MAALVAQVALKLHDCNAQNLVGSAPCLGLAAIFFYCTVGINATSNLTLQHWMLCRGLASLLPRYARHWWTEEPLWDCRNNVV